MVPNQIDSFDSEPSELVRLFALRVTGSESKPALAIRILVRKLLVSAKRRGTVCGLDHYLRLRNVVGIDYSRNIDCDGFIKPLGTKYDDGFRVVINSDCQATRSRFTLCHELTHTYFYQIVPEIKFYDNFPDPLEERLCNFGAAEMLMPSARLKKEAKGLTASLSSLEMLAASFQVSTEAMLLRLRSIGLWNSLFSVWHPMTGGSFSLHRLVGMRRVEWEWPEPDVLREAWDTQRPFFGRTCLECRGKDGKLKLQPVFYEVKRRGDTIRALLNPVAFRRTPPHMPLFETNR